MNYAIFLDIFSSYRTSLVQNEGEPVDGNLK